MKHVFTLLSAEINELILQMAAIGSGNLKDGRVEVSIKFIHDIKNFIYFSVHIVKHHHIFSYLSFHRSFDSFIVNISVYVVLSQIVELWSDIILIEPVYTPKLSALIPVPTALVLSISKPRIPSITVSPIVETNVKQLSTFTTLIYRIAGV